MGDNLRVNWERRISLQDNDRPVGIDAFPIAARARRLHMGVCRDVAIVQTQCSGFFCCASWFSNSNRKADASDMEGWWRINGCDL